MERLYAAVIDYAIIGFAYGIVTFFVPQQVLTTMLSPLTMITTSIPPSLQLSSGYLAYVFGMYLSVHLLLMASQYAYTICCMHLAGQTIGKKFMRIKIVTESTHTKPTLTTLIFRETMGKFLSGVFLGLGYVAFWGNSKKQTWHDRISKTIVIRAKTP